MAGSRVRVVLIAIALVLLSLSASATSGAIFTTNATGTRVNQNLFLDKCAVYLDGGPGPNAPIGAAGLPAGDYFFQVTDPSGQVLLSTDPVSDRRFTVNSDGIISANPGTHAIGADTDHNALTIQLCPYLDTPNNGGVYKVWVTKVDDFAGTPGAVDSGYTPGNFHGFIPAFSKTDNFKVGATAGGPCLAIGKFQDLVAPDPLGKLDPGEPFLVWEFTVIDPLGTQVNGTIFTPAWPSPPTAPDNCLLYNLAPGKYTISEPYAASVPTVNIVDGKYLKHPSRDIEVRFQNSDHVVIFGNKFLDYTK